MKKVIAVVLACMMLFALTACSEGGSGSKGKFEIADSAYLVDEDSGDYSVVVIVENNSGSTIKEALCTENALDENGKTMASKGISAAASFMWVGEGEKEAYMFTTVDLPGESLFDHYEALPDTVEWEVVEAKSDKDLTPLGLSIAECTMTGDYDDWAEYDLTIRNDSETDYLYDPESMRYKTDIADFTVEAVVVYRDTDGNIKDAELITPRPASQKDIPANGEVTLASYSNHVCRDDDLTPEYYLFKNECNFH